MIADPLWSCVMLLCGPLRYLVIPLISKYFHEQTVPVTFTSDGKVMSIVYNIAKDWFIGMGLPENHTLLWTSTGNQSLRTQDTGPRSRPRVRPWTPRFRLGELADASVLWVSASAYDAYGMEQGQDYPPMFKKGNARLPDN